MAAGLGKRCIRSAASTGLIPTIARRTDDMRYFQQEALAVPKQTTVSIFLGQFFTIKCGKHRDLDTSGRLFSRPFHNVNLYK